ncbi:MAG: hypothetical protein NC818_02735 [Candidatus Omnitrophica bacterium]|nr:hypothetical protein [Candidatus Omnitrophota bacterium]
MKLTNQKLKYFVKPFKILLIFLILNLSFGYLHIADIFVISVLSRRIRDFDFSYIRGSKEAKVEWKYFGLTPAMFQRILDALIESGICSVSGRKGVIFIGGTSAGGKSPATDFITAMLRGYGINVKYISLDNYYKDREKMPTSPDGNFDFDSVEALDIDKFQKHLHILLTTSEEITPPHFDMKTGKSSDGKDPIQLLEGEVLIVEGIHALTPRMTNKERDGDIIPPEVVRLMFFVNAERDTRLPRRMVRDSEVRGYIPEATIWNWDKIVVPGEDNHIIPGKIEALKLAEERGQKIIEIDTTLPLDKISDIQPLGEVFRESLIQAGERMGKLIPLLEKEDFYSLISQVQGSELSKSLVAFLKIKSHQDRIRDLLRSLDSESEKGFIKIIGEGTPDQILEFLSETLLRYSTNTSFREEMNLLRLDLLGAMRYVARRIDELRNKYFSIP